MDRGSNKRRLTWFGKSRPGTLGKMWQQMPREEIDSDAWLARRQPIPVERAPRRDGRGSQQPDWQALPPLPKWPPLPEEDPLAPGRLSEDALFMPDETQQTEWLTEQKDQRIPNRYTRLKQPLSTLWQRFRSAPRQKRFLLMAGAGGVLLLLLVSVTVLAGALRSHVPGIGPAGGSAQGITLSPTTARATPTVTLTPETNTPTPPFTLAFTCASGTVGGMGQVCVHTAPRAALSLTVRYCDGNSAKGKGFHGATYADGSGNYTWRWDISNSCVGSATATVVAKSAGQTVTESTTFIVSR
jgi:hypothetical protein